MARTQLAAQAITDAGLLPALTAANVDGHWISPGDILWVENGAGASINVTIPTPVTLGGKAVADTVVAVPNGSRRLIGDLEGNLYGQTSGVDAGRVYVDFSSVTSITVAALRP